MKAIDIYRRAVATGMENDPRGAEAVRRALEEKKKEFAELKEEDKKFFDMESLQNPYPDSRMLAGDGERDVRAALVGIDIEAPELLLTDALRQRGKEVDLVISHHPEGRPYANLYEVMGMQSEIFSRFGVPINIAEDLMEGRMREVERRLMPVNHTRAVDAARLLGVPFMCLHTVADNMVSTYLQKMFEEKKPETLADVLKLLKAIPEYEEGAKNGAGPKLLIGAPKRRAGKVFVDMTGGTEGSKEIFQSMTACGINTVVAMHLSEEHRKEAEKSHINAIIAGHISSDNLGVNLLLDSVMRGSPFEVLGCSGFKRVERSPH
jgi:hypothetical protein